MSDYNTYIRPNLFFQCFLQAMSGHLGSATSSQGWEVRQLDLWNGSQSKMNIFEHIWVFPKIGVPQNGWFTMENPIKMDDLGYPYFLETPIYEHDMTWYFPSADKCNMTFEIYETLRRWFLGMISKAGIFLFLKRSIFIFKPVSF